MKNIENKEGSCKYYVPHYVKVGNSFITCRAGLLKNTEEIIKAKRKLKKRTKIFRALF